MIDKEIVLRARELKKNFGVKCSKFSGAMTIELLRTALKEEGIPTSARDVFVQGIPLEIDLIIPRGQQEPLLDLLYEPHQVSSVLEVKSMGSFGEKTLSKIRKDFTRFFKAGISCAYVTFEERQSYKWAASSERLGNFPCFTLAWHKASEGPIEPTGDWDRLVTFLRERIRK